MDVTEEYLVELLAKQNGRCAYTGLPMTLPGHYGCTGDRRLCASLDRIDSTINYFIYVYY